MEYFKQDYKEFLRGGYNYDYAIIDPPWKYNQPAKKSIAKNQLCYNLWDNKELINLLNIINVDYIFLWVTNPMLGEVFDYIKESGKFKYKTILTWVKLKNNKIMYGMGYHLKNASEQMLVLAKPKAKPLRLIVKNVVIEEIGKRTSKPHSKEKEIVDAMNKKGMKGIYLFSGGPLDFIDTVDIV